MFINASLKQQQGFGLLEMILAIFLGSLILGLCQLIFMDYLKTQHLEEDLMDWQQKARFSQYIISRALMTAGFAICYQSNEGVRVTQEGENDVITINKINPITWVVVKKNNSHSVLVDGISPNIKKNDPIVITDCLTTLQSTVTSVTQNFLTQQQSIRINLSLPDSLGVGAIVGKRETEKFYLSRDAITHKNALFERTAENKNTELIPDVLSMKIQVLINNNWRSTEDVIDQEKIQALKINLMITTNKKSIEFFVLSGSG